jgi:hypothetical protein
MYLVLSYELFTDQLKAAWLFLSKRKKKQKTAWLFLSAGFIFESSSRIKSAKLIDARESVCV